MQDLQLLRSPGRRCADEEHLLVGLGARVAQAACGEYRNPLGFNLTI